jgi:peptidoglycan/LPS O-acetylase OafA/YrhL
MRISLVMPVVAFWVARASARLCLAAALLLSMASFALVLAEGRDASSANFIGDWAMTGHYLSIFIVGATLAVHRARWRHWLEKRDRTMAVLAGSLALYFLSRSVMSVSSGAIGQFVFDWCVAAGAAGIVCTALVWKPFALILAARPIVFLGTISYSLYLTHTVVLLAVVHLMPSPDSVWRAIVTAAVLVIPVAAVTHFVVERPSMLLGKFLTGRSAVASSRANQTS